MEPRMNGSSLGPEPVYLPQNEPYRGRASVLSFDRAIRACMKANKRVATHTGQIELTDPQNAACQLIPQGINLALAIRALVRQGYLFGALVLIRPLLERVAVMSYLRAHPSDITLWKEGWKYRKRPTFSKMLKTMTDKADTAMVQEVADSLNHIVHGDPVGSQWNLVPLSGGAVAYAAGQVTNHPELCDRICSEAQCYLILLHGMMAACFPDTPDSQEIFKEFR